MTLQKYILSESLLPNIIENFLNKFKTDVPFRKLDYDINRDYLENEEFINKFINESYGYEDRKDAVYDPDEDGTEFEYAINILNGVYETVTRFLNTHTIEGNVGIVIYRSINVNLYTTRNNFGIYWAFEDPDIYFSDNEGRDDSYSFVGIVDESYIDWEFQFMNLWESTITQSFEKEIRILKGAPVIIYQYYEGVGIPTNKISVNPIKIKA